MNYSHERVNGCLELTARSNECWLHSQLVSLNINSLLSSCKFSRKDFAHELFRELNYWRLLPTKEVAR